MITGSCTGPLHLSLLKSIALSPCVQMTCLRNSVCEVSGHTCRNGVGQVLEDPGICMHYKTQVVSSSWCSQAFWAEKTDCAHSKMFTLHRTDEKKGYPFRCQECVLGSTVTSANNNNNNNRTLSVSFIRDQRTGNITKEGPELPWRLLCNWEGSTLICIHHPRKHKDAAPH